MTILTPLWSHNLLPGGGGHDIYNLCRGLYSLFQYAVSFFFIFHTKEKNWPCSFQVEVKSC